MPPGLSAESALQTKTSVSLSRTHTLTRTHTRAPSQAGRSFKLSFSAAHGWFRASKGLGGGVFPCRHTATHMPAVVCRITKLACHLAHQHQHHPQHVTHTALMLSCPLASHSLSHISPG